MKNKELWHYHRVKNGAVVQFPTSACYFMKVSTDGGYEAIINLYTGELLFDVELDRKKLGMLCTIVAQSLDDFSRENEV